MKSHPTILGAVLLSLISAPSPAGAESAAPHYSKGILAYNRGAYAEAADALAAAAALDPASFDAHYYRGAALVELGRYAEARPALERALALKPGDGGCLFSLGLCALAARDYDGASGLFERAAGADPRYRAYASYYGGVALARLERPDAARERFRLLLGEDGVPADVREACRRDIAALARERDKRWFFSCTARYEYDSNVTLAPEDSAVVDSSGQGDFRFLTTGDLRLVPVKWKKFELDTEYLFSQSVHNHLGDYNMQGHSLVNTAILKLDPLQPFAGYEFDYTFLDDCKESFVRTNAILAGFNLFPSSFALTQFNYRWSNDRFFDIPDLDDYDRNGRNNSAGFDQYLFFGGEGTDFARFGFYYDHNSATGDAYRYDGYRFAWELSKGLFAGLMLDATAEYYARDFYRDPLRNRDNRQTYTATLSRPLNDYLEAGFSYYFCDNSSGEEFFAYNRNIFTLYCAANF